MTNIQTHICLSFSRVCDAKFHEIFNRTIWVDETCVRCRACVFVIVIRVYLTSVCCRFSSARVRKVMKILKVKCIWFCIFYIYISANSRMVFPTPCALFITRLALNVFFFCIFLCVVSAEMPVGHHNVEYNDTFSNATC